MIHELSKNTKEKKTNFSLITKSFNFFDLSLKQLATSIQ